MARGANATEADEKVWTITAPVVPGREPWNGELFRRNGRAVRFVDGVAKVTDELALAVEFPITGASVDPTDASPLDPPYSPGEALALHIVSDYSRPGREYTVKPAIRRAPERKRELRMFSEGVQTPGRPQGMLRKSATQLEQGAQT